MCLGISILHPYPARTLNFLIKNFKKFSEFHSLHVLASKMSILNYLLIDPTERLRLGIQVTGRFKGTVLRDYY
jgi:hypothetical protein